MRAWGACRMRGGPRAILGAGCDHVRRLPCIRGGLRAILGVGHMNMRSGCDHVSLACRVRGGPRVVLVVCDHWYLGGVAPPVDDGGVPY
eukprot:6033956-Prymnesium_polylepis.1